MPVKIELVIINMFVLPVLFLLFVATSIHLVAGQRQHLERAIVQERGPLPGVPFVKFTDWEPTVRVEEPSSGPVVVVPDTLGAIIENDPRLTRLREQVNQFSGLKTILNNPQLNLTVFAPSDDAFDKLGSNARELLFGPRHVNAVLNVFVLLTHILSAELSPLQLDQDVVYLMLTMSGIPVSLARGQKRGTFELERHETLGEPLFAVNGVLYVATDFVDPLARWNVSIHQDDVSVFQRYLYLEDK